VDTKAKLFIKTLEEPELLDVADISDDEVTVIEEPVNVGLKNEPVDVDRARTDQTSVDIDTIVQGHIQRIIPSLMEEIKKQVIAKLTPTQSSLSKPVH
jgi:hypothetical protein